MRYKKIILLFIICILVSGSLAKALREDSQDNVNKEQQDKVEVATKEDTSTAQDESKKETDNSKESNSKNSSENQDDKKKDDQDNKEKKDDKKSQNDDDKKEKKPKDKKPKDKKDTDKGKKKKKDDKSKPEDDQIKEKIEEKASDSVDQIQDSIVNIGDDISAGFGDAFELENEEPEFISSFKPQQTHKNGVHQIDESELPKHIGLGSKESIIDETSNSDGSTEGSDEQEYIDSEDEDEEAFKNHSSNKKKQQKSQGVLDKEQEIQQKFGKQIDAEEERISRKQKILKKDKSEFKDGGQQSFFQQKFDELINYIFQRDQKFVGKQENIESPNELLQKLEDKEKENDEQSKNQGSNGTETTVGNALSSDVDSLASQLGDGISDLGNVIVNPSQIFDEASDLTQETIETPSEVVHQTENAVDQVSQMSEGSASTLANAPGQAISTPIEYAKEQLEEEKEKEIEQQKKNPKFLSTRSRGQKKHKKKDCSCGNGGSTSTTINKPNNKDCDENKKKNESLLQKLKEKEQNKKEDQDNEVINNTQTVGDGLSSDVNSLSNQLSEGISDLGDTILNPSEIFDEASDLTQETIATPSEVIHQTENAVDQVSQMSEGSASTLANAPGQAISTPIEYAKEQLEDEKEEEIGQQKKNQKVLSTRLRGQKKHPKKDCSCGTGGSTSTTVGKPNKKDCDKNKKKHQKEKNLIQTEDCGCGTGDPTVPNPRPR